MLTGVVYPLVVTGDRAARLPGAGERQPDRARRHGRRLGADRPAVRRPEVLLGPAVGDRRRSPTTAPPRRGSNLGPLEPGARERGRRRASTRCAPPIPATRAPVPVDLVTAVRQRARPAHQPGRGALPGRARRAGARPRPGGACARWSTQHTEGRQLGVLGEPRVNVLELNLALDALARVTAERLPDERAPRSRRAARRGAGRGARSAQRGRLKIFFGAAPGVGKTYAMLEAAREREREGVDVVVGVRRDARPRRDRGAARGPRGRPAARRVEYRGVSARRRSTSTRPSPAGPRSCWSTSWRTPTRPGSRHPKRWQDVEELLDAGIDVYTTLNIQHLESLNDVVAQITGVRVRETVPDVGLRARRRDRARRPAARGPAQAPARGQGLRARRRRERAIAELLHARAT